MEIKITPTATEFVTYIGGDGYTAPLAVKSDGTTQNYLYLQRDYQGSIVAITDASGYVLEKRLFDAWGNVLVQNGAGTVLSGLNLLDRGYTGHEHLQSVGLINMNGRLYDPKLHRFLQPDNYVQDPSNTQNYNRYGYVLNNPLKYIDPSGESFGSWIKDNWKNILIMTAAVVVGVAIAVVTAGTGTGLSAILISGVEGAISSGTIWAGALGGAIMGGSIVHGINQSKPDNGNPNQGSGSSNGGNQNTPVATPKSDTDRGNEVNCKDCVNPASIGHNIGYLSYPGGDNPMTYGRKYTYSYVPTNFAEFPAIGHDRRYDRLGTSGISGLLFDTRAIGADWKFVEEEMLLAFTPYLNPIDRGSAAGLGFGLGVLSLTKTVLQLATPHGYFQAMYWYQVSNVGVNNIPSIHKH